MSLWLSLLAALLVLEPGSGFDTGMSFSGNLERVGDKSVSVRLADRRVVDAMLPNTPALESEAIAAQYRLGDEVEITCKAIQPVWEEGTSRYQSLEVTAMRFLHRPSPEQVAGLLEVKPREGKNLLEQPELTISVPHKAADLNAPGGRELEHARRVNLEYAANMPNFVADEKAERYRSTSKSPRWSHFDTIAAEITFRGNRAVRQQIRRNGKPWEEPFDALPGFKWYEGFETEITPLFDARCPTTIEYQGRSKLAGRQLLEYRFSSPVDGCFPFFYFTYQRFNPARTGNVFIDDADGNVIRVDDQTHGFPEDFEFAEREQHVSWDYVKIGESSHLLPVHADFLVLYHSGTRYRIEVEYKNHRHFETSSDVTFH
jgi:hypothetical protein